MRPALLSVVMLVGSSCGAFSGVASTGAGTPPNCTAIIDYIDFVRQDGVFYSASNSILGRAITSGDLGAERFRVKNTVSSTTCDPYYHPVDGDAAFVATGEPVFVVKGYAPSFRLAARHNDMLVLYEADSNPAARRGADLMDIEGRVKSIALLDQKTGRTGVSRITDRSRVDGLVHMIASASIDPSYPSPQATRPVDYMHLAFELDDGTASVRAYDRTNGVVWRGIQVGAAFTTAVDELVRTAPTPSPVPTTLNLARRYDLAHATRVSIKDLKAGKGASAAMAPLVASLDADLPARRGQRPSGDYIVVIFEFPDRYVSLAYDESTNTLTVVAPDDELAVQVSPTFRGLIP
jgi:hypothetical protein